MATTTTELSRTAFTVRVPADVYERLRNIQFEERISFQRIAEDALDRWLAARNDAARTGLEQATKEERELLEQALALLRENRDSKLREVLVALLEHSCTKPQVS